MAERENVIIFNQRVVQQPEITMADNKKCAHTACKCQAKEGTDYCSTYCEGVGKTPEIQCNCGHPACSSTAKL